MAMESKSEIAPIPHTPMPGNVQMDWAGWRQMVLTVMIVMVPVVFFGAGLAKAVGSPQHVDNFVRWGYPVSVMHLVGAAEMALAALLVFRRTRFWAATGLMVLLTGALITHLASVDLAMITGPMLLLFPVGAVAWSTRPWRTL